MGKINFVPDDYVQGTESRRTNFMYIGLLVIVMAGLAACFGLLKWQQTKCEEREEEINARMVALQEEIAQSEKLQARHKQMLKQAVTTSELIEQVPRSVLIASLTNNLPSGVSLSNVQIVQAKSKEAAAPKVQNNYQKVKNEKAKEVKPGVKVEEEVVVVSEEKLYKTTFNISGLARSDIQVAAYIERLGNSPLFANVALVESKEKKVEESVYREFKLTAKLKEEVQIADEHIKGIRAGI